MLNKVPHAARIFCLTLLLSVFAFVPQFCLADGIMISPSVTEEVAKPGDIISKSIKVVNESSSPRKIFPYLRDFVPNGEDGTPRLVVPGSEAGNFISPWVSLDQEGVEIQPGGEHVFRFAINIPQNAGPGGYYGAIVFGTKAQDVSIDSADKGAASAVSQQAASLVLLKLPGGAEEAADIKDFASDKSVYNTPYTVNFKTRIKNNGNTHVSPQGFIRITNMLDREVAKVEFNKINSNILPKSVRQYTNAWSDNFGFGRYRAELVLSYGTAANEGGNGRQSLQSVAYFWIMPWKFIIPVLGGLLIFALLSYLSLRSYKNRAVRRALKEAGAGAKTVQRRNAGSRATHQKLQLLMVVIVLLVVLLLFALGMLLFA